MSNNKKRKPVLMGLMFSILAVVFILTSSSLAQTPDFNATPLIPNDAYGANRNVTNSTTSSPSNKIDFDVVSELETVSIIVTYNDFFNPTHLEATTDGKIIHQYRSFNGASMVLSGEKVEGVATMRGVTAVYLDERQQIETDSSPDFIGAPTVWNTLGGQSQAGEGTLFASLDSGVWPEHPSFSDPDPFGNSYPSPTTSYPCEFGNTTWNTDDAPFTCNNKLVGAYAFLDTYKAVTGLTANEFDSARDDDGHGTHTATTAAGNGNVPATIAGSDLGHVSGIAPRAQVIVYKVCGAAGCYSSDAMAAIEQAILDDVDVINYSISGGNHPYDDIVSLAFLRAYENGIFVAKSAGNSGPNPDTVAGRSPWVTTVAASTQSRTFSATLDLNGANGDTLQLDGVSITGSHTGSVVLASAFGDGQCLTPFAANTWTNNEIVVCERGEIARVTKGYNVLQGGAGGYVLYNPAPNTLVPDNHFLPAIHIQDGAGTDLLAFLAEPAHLPANGTITGGIRSTAQANVMASFSSRGGPGQTLGVSKPDIAAPGVQILAGQTPLPNSTDGGASGQFFQIIQGTSMSSPHVAGSALLLKAMHPDWSPGQIKSALMTSAYTDGLVKEDGSTPVDNFDAGSGHIDLTHAIDPGLTISATGADYRDHEYDLWNTNYPSLYIPVMPGEMEFTRIVHSELDEDSWWRLRIDGPDDLRIKVRSVIGIRANRDKLIRFTIDASRVPHGEVRHATLIMTHGSGEHIVRFPITLVRAQPEVMMETDCSPSNFVQRETAVCAITVTNNSFDDANIILENEMPRRLRIVENTVDGANEESDRMLSFSGDLYGAEPAIVDVADGTGTTPGYLPLTMFGVTPLTNMGDESIVNFTLPAIEFAGETYTQIGMVSNGYLIMGGGTAEDVSYVNQIFPDTTTPNNIIAPFWTDLNPDAGGNVYASILSDPLSGLSWVVFEWAQVPNYDDGEPNTFQVWIGINGEQDISFVYGDVSDGNNGFVTVGAENSYGNSGGNWFANGEGTPIVAGDEVMITSLPGAPGESHAIEFEVTGWAVGNWSNCVELTSDLFEGTNVVCFSGEITAASSWNP
ncbi:MAG: S8 family serine peptidase [Chloroflexi bacterium]|nr:S8 family serine peptidase [Chloroflexota bacterium]